MVYTFWRWLPLWGISNWNSRSEAPGPIKNRNAKPGCKGCVPVFFCVGLAASRMAIYSETVSESRKISVMHHRAAMPTKV